MTRVTSFPGTVPRGARSNQEKRHRLPALSPPCSYQEAQEVPHPWIIPVSKLDPPSSRMLPECCGESRIGQATLEKPEEGLVTVQNEMDSACRWEPSSWSVRSLPCRWECGRRSTSSWAHSGQWDLKVHTQHRGEHIVGLKKYVKCTTEENHGSLFT